MGTLQTIQPQAYERVTPEDWQRISNSIRQRKRIAIFQAIRFLDSRGPGEVAKVKLPEGETRAGRRRAMEAARGYADRRGFQIQNYYKDGWLYMERV